MYSVLGIVTIIVVATLIMFILGFVALLIVKISSALGAFIILAGTLAVIIACVTKRR